MNRRATITILSMLALCIWIMATNSIFSIPETTIPTKIICSGSVLVFYFLIVRFWYFKLKRNQ